MSSLFLMTTVLLGCVGAGLLIGILVVRLGHRHDPLDDTGDAESEHPREELALVPDAVTVRTEVPRPEGLAVLR